MVNNNNNDNDNTVITVVTHMIGYFIAGKFWGEQICCYHAFYLNLENESSKLSEPINDAGLVNPQNWILQYLLKSENVKNFLHWNFLYTVLYHLNRLSNILYIKNHCC